MTQALSAGRSAYEKNAWEEAFLELTKADGESPLDPADLDHLADAAWWSGHIDESVEALDRAYVGYVQHGENEAAAGIALRLGERALRTGQGSVAQGWMGRADRLLENAPESAVNAWLEFMRAAVALIPNKDPELALTHADRAIELGKTHADPDVVSIALSFKGAALTKLGRVEEGLALIDESAAAATSGELRAKTACDVYCFTIAACRDVSDLQRSAEWTERAEQYMKRLDIPAYPGACRVHRAELKRFHGRWSEAEQEARAACEELERFRLLDLVADAYNEIGEVRLRLGDLDGAEVAFAKAFEYGRDPQPGMAYLHLARGDVQEASRSLRRSLGGGVGEDGYDLGGRMQKLPAKVEIDVATGDFESALSAVEELEAASAEHDNPIWAAGAATARGVLAIAKGDSSVAIDRFGSAWRLWQEVDFPYESALARTKLGEARRADGDESGARLEFNAALAVLQRLGAGRDIARVERLLDRADDAPASTVMTRTFMFTDIVTSTDLIGLIGDSAWADLIRWHDRTLKAAFAEHRGEVVNHTGDGFFVAFDKPGSALQCAVSIQRTLHDHRRDHGFSPSIRIGIHSTEATRTDGSYTGGGIHVAARVSALAEADEILVTSSTIADVDVGYPTSGSRSVGLKGVAGEVDVVSVDWRAQ